MAPSGINLNSITVELSSNAGEWRTTLNNISSSMTIGELKATHLKVRSNARFGRLNKYENWDNQRPLSDYFVQDGEIFLCVLQCIVEEGQTDVDDYNEWLAANRAQ